jgi:hypothetical protein
MVVVVYDTQPEVIAFGVVPLPLVWSIGEPVACPLSDVPFTLEIDEAAMPVLLSTTPLPLTWNTDPTPCYYDDSSGVSSRLIDENSNQLTDENGDYLVW